MTLPSVLIPVAPGTNRDEELAVAFERAGGVAAREPLARIRNGEVKLADHQVLAVPGGFSYGDALGAGRLLGLDLDRWFGDQLLEARERGMAIIGICNGFQALVRAGLLPGPAPQGTSGVDGDPAGGASDRPSANLTHNANGRFECRWVELLPGTAASPWLDGLTEPLRCPIAHGEGRFVTSDLAAFEEANQVAFRYGTSDEAGTVPADGAYPANPNGSEGDIAGIVDPTGMVLGLMPHPEDHVLDRHTPGRWVDRPDGRLGQCLPLFSAGLRAVA
jgi:phosphoribosylformylglycinamidine synthase